LLAIHLSRLNTSANPLFSPPSTWDSLTMPTQQTFLRQRGAVQETPLENINDEPAPRQRREEVVWGKTPGGEGIPDRFSSLALFSTLSTSFPRPHNPRCFDYVVQSWVSKKPPGSTEPGLTWLTTRCLLPTATSRLSSLFLLLLCLLARCLRCWARLGPD
jgi:hypothetical protein